MVHRLMRTNLLPFVLQPQSFDLLSTLEEDQPMKKRMARSKMGEMLGHQGLMQILKPDRLIQKMACLLSPRVWQGTLLNETLGHLAHATRRPTQVLAPARMVPRVTPNQTICRTVLLTPLTHYQAGQMYPFPLI